MTLQEAIKQGSKFKRAAWKDRSIQVISNYLCPGSLDPNTNINDICLSKDFASLTINDILANDWEVLSPIVSFVIAMQALSDGRQIRNIGWLEKIPLIMPLGRVRI